MKHECFIVKRKIIVRAQIKGVNDDMNFKFILDTGASKTVVDEGVARQLGFDLKQLKIGDRLMTAGGGTNSKILVLPKLTLLGKDTINFDVNVIKFPPQITYFSDGLIGMDFLLQFENIKFDFEKKIIETEI